MVGVSDAPGFDGADLVSRHGGDPQVAASLVDMFLEDAAAALVDAKAATANEACRGLLSEDYHQDRVPLRDGMWLPDGR